MEERKMLNLQVNETDAFKATYEVEMITCSELTRLVDRLFGAIFSDYHACKLVPIQNQFGAGAGYELNLAFRPIAGTEDGVNKDGKYPAFVQRNSTTAGGNEIYNSLKRTAENNKAGTSFIISQSATELLRELFIDVFVFRDRQFETDPNPKRYMQKALIGEQFVKQQANYGRVVQIVEECILHIDINKVLQMIKGAVNEKGEKMFYDIRPITDIFANIPNQTGFVPIKSETIVEIRRLNGEVWENFNSRIGAIGQNNTEQYSQMRIVR